MSLEEIAATLKRIEGEVHTISRGIYGDLPNGVKGLIKTDQDQEKRIQDLEEKDKKQKWMFVGALIVIEAAIQFVKIKIGA